MTPVITVLIALGVPLILAGLWLGVTSLIGLASGWYALARAFPDSSETPTLALAGQSGFMGAAGVRMNGVLRLAICASGLRVGMARLLGPFCRDFLVPWADIHPRPRKSLFVTLASLEFGAPPRGRLDIDPRLAARLAEAAGPSWPAA